MIDAGAGPTLRATTLAVALALLGGILVVLAAGLRPDAFFVGDPGVKLISARNALRFPAHPLQIPLPKVGNASMPHVENFFAVHGDHSHAVTSELFPLVSAPLLAAFGPRGLYVLPALGLLATIASAAWLGVVLDRRRDPVLIGVVALLGTPFLLYGLEFWEHMPAVALAVAGTALLLAAARQRPGRDAGTGASFTSGLLFGLAIVLRPEAACFVAAVLAASRMLVYRPTWRSIAVAIGGTVVAILPLEIYTVVHFGSIVPGHVGPNAALLGAAWPVERLQLIAEWLSPSMWSGPAPVNRASFWSVSPAAVVALVGLAVPSTRDGRGFLWLVFALTVLFVVLSAPNDGGGQWGPRYLLPAYVPLILIATDVIQQMPRTAWTWVVVIVLVAAGVWMQRAAYRQLRGTKATYGRIVDFVRETSSAGPDVVTDAWWLDQLAASALADKTLLFAGDDDTGREIVHRLSDLTVPAVTVIRSREESPDVESWSAATCYFEEQRDELSVRGLVAIRLRHRCGYKPETTGNGP